MNSCVRAAEQTLLDRAGRALRACALKCCKLVTGPRCPLLSLQAANSYLRDQWFHSLQWKVSPESVAH